MDVDVTNLNVSKNENFLGLENLPTTVPVNQEATNELSGTTVKPFSNARISFEVNLQPEKVVEDYKYEDGSHSYRVRWKDTWIHEQLIPAYQTLVDEYWTSKPLQEKEAISKIVPILEETSTQTSPEDITPLDFPPLFVDSTHEDGNKGNENNSTLLNEFPKMMDDSSLLPVNKSNILPPLEGDKVKPMENTQLVPLENSVIPSKKDEKIQPDEDRVAPLAADETDIDFKGANLSNDAPRGDESTSSSTERGEGSTLLNEEMRLKRKRKSSSIVKKYSKKRRGRPRKTKGANENENKLNLENDTNKQEEEPKEKGKTADQKGPCTCNICGKVISNKYGLREHQAVVHFKNGKFQCEICGKRVTNKRALNLHMTSHSNERSFVCTQCGSSHKTKGNLNYHIKTMHETVKNFRCDICFKTFKVQADLKEHCFSMHSNAGVITCIVCKKKLTTALSIYTHSVMHSGAREYECDICGYAFKTLTGLKEHKITHLETKPIRNCPYCERKFYSRSQYNAHVMRHTADGSLITFKCPICDVKFQHKSSYNRHVIRHQPGGDLEFPKENPYLLVDESELPDGVCHKCRKYYASKSGFYLHLKKCRDGIVQQFQCPYCERGCSNKSSLKRHVQRRHKGMEFECQGVQPREVIQESTAQALEVPQPTTTVITPDNSIQFQTTYFDHGYGNQIAANQLSTVDVQLLIDGPTTDEQVGAPTNSILGTVGESTQVGDAGENTQNLHILTENEAAQLAAQLTQHGVIVRSSNETLAVNRDQEQQIIVSAAAHIDSRTGQLFVSHSQAAEILANAQALRTGQLNGVNGAGMALQDGQNAILRGDGVLQFENRPAVILHPANVDIPTQQVITISNQNLQSDNELQGQTVERIENTYNPENIHGNAVINEISVSNALNAEGIPGTHEANDSLEAGSTNVQQNESEAQLQTNTENEDIEREIQEHQIVLNGLQDDTTDVSDNVILI